jgi:ketosteroid isomerase-like protein
MSAESTTPDLVELTRSQFEAVNRRDLETVMSFCPPDGVYDVSPSGLGTFERPAAVRGSIKDWWDSFEDLRFELEEVLDVGHGVVLAVARQDARPVGSSGRVQRREACVLQWDESMTARVPTYANIDGARAVAERLAQERE